MEKEITLTVRIRDGKATCKVKAYSILTPEELGMINNAVQSQIHSLLKKTFKSDSSNLNF